MIHYHYTQGCKMVSSEPIRSPRTLGGLPKDTEIYKQANDLNDRREVCLTPLRLLTCDESFLT